VVQGTEKAVAPIWLEAETAGADQQCLDLSPQMASDVLFNLAGIATFVDSMQFDAGWMSAAGAALVRGSTSCDARQATARVGSDALPSRKIRHELAAFNHLEMLVAFRRVRIPHADWRGLQAIDSYMHLAAKFLCSPRASGLKSPMFEAFTSLTMKRLDAQTRKCISDRDSDVNPRAGPLIPELPGAGTAIQDAAHWAGSKLESWPDVWIDSMHSTNASRLDPRPSLNVVYASHDFTDHPTAWMIEGAIATHSRPAHSVVPHAIHFGVDDGKETLARINLIAS